MLWVSVVGLGIKENINRGRAFDNNSRARRRNLAYTGGSLASHPARTPVHQHKLTSLGDEPSLAGKQDGVLLDRLSARPAVCQGRYVLHDRSIVRNSARRSVDVGLEVEGPFFARCESCRQYVRWETSNVFATVVPTISITISINFGSTYV